MRALTLTGVITPDHMLMVQVPEDILSGRYEVVIVLQEDSLVRQPEDRFTAGWPVHDSGPMDPNMTFRREDIYGDDGR